MRASDSRGRHISGAEGIYDSLSSASRAAGRYSARAMSHPRGEPAEVVVTVERLRRRPRLIKALPVRTLECPSSLKADAEIRELLLKEGVSRRALGSAFRVIRGGRVMRGAALVDAVSGRRLEPDRKRGVRATLMGVEPGALGPLKMRLGRMGINTQIVIEALTLATKVAHAPGVMAELCASDDPDYTTGYVASKGSGYVRVANIKKKGSMAGGRIIFLSPGADVDKLLRYLQGTPVLVG